MERTKTARAKLVAMRKERGLTQQQFAAVLGVRSKVYVSQLENGVCPFTIELALKAERWVEGEIRAPDLLPLEQAELLQDAVARAASLIGSPG